MAAPFNYQIFNNVTDRETFLNNIRNVATANGWTIDKDDISANQELYLHSNGNGNQNLYFSMKVDYYYVADYMFIQGNTGFDANSTWDNQPGKFTSPNAYADNNYYRAMPYLWFPIQKQYILVNSQMILVFCDMVSTSPILTGRVVTHFVLGAIDTYKDSDTEGNLIITYQIAYKCLTYNGGFGGYSSDILGTRLYNNTASRDFGLLYYSTNKFNTDLGISVHIVSDCGHGDYTIGSKGYQYTHAVQFNDWASRTSLIKPIVSIKHTTTEDVFFYPIGELPYYACKAYPYYKAGDIITQGTRNFMVFPILEYTNEYGVAIEVNV